MFDQLLPLAQCVRTCGLAPHEIVLGVAPGREHAAILSSYQRRRPRPSDLRAALASDIRAAAAAGANRRAADLLVALRGFLAQTPAANVVSLDAYRRERSHTSAGRNCVVRATL